MDFHLIRNIKGQWFAVFKSVKEATDAKWMFPGKSITKTGTGYLNSYEVDNMDVWEAGGV